MTEISQFHGLARAVRKIPVPGTISSDVIISLDAEIGDLENENRQLRFLLDLAVRYLAKAAADGLMLECVLSPATALKRIETGLAELDHE